MHLEALVAVHGAVCLFRHGQARKNVESRHGGQGSTLTGAGLKQVRVSARTLTDLGFSNSIIRFAHKPQCEETAKTMRTEMGGHVFPLEGIDTFHLGVLDGLSDEEVRTRFPDLHRQMSDWHLGKIEICDLEIPGASNPTEYFEPAERIASKFRHDENLIVVGTRSINLVLASVLLGRRPERGGGYRAIIWPNAGYLIFRSESGSWSLDERMSNFRVDK